MKVCEKCGNEISTRDGDNQCSDCENNEFELIDEKPKRRGKKRNARARANRRAINDAMDSLGLKRVRGAMGGVYYE